MQAFDLRSKLAPEELVHKGGVRDCGRRLLAGKRALLHGVDEVARELVRVLLPPWAELPREARQQAHDGLRRVHARVGREGSAHVRGHHAERVELDALGAALLLERAIERRRREGPRVRQALHHAVEEARVAEVAQPGAHRALRRPAELERVDGAQRSHARAIS